MKFTLMCLVLIVLVSGTGAIERKRNGKEDCQVMEDGSVICKGEEQMAVDEIDDYDDDDDDDDDDMYDDEEEEEIICGDNHELCSFWAAKGECKNNPNYMVKNCMKSCNTCASRKLKTNRNNNHLIQIDNERLLEEIAQYGEPQQVDGEKKNQTMLVVKKTVNYMKNYIFAENPTHRLSPTIIGQCKNNHSLCSFWAVIGECEKNISYMTTKCAPSCQSCSNIDFNNRCPKRAADAKPGLLPGDLNLMFERLVATAPGNQTDESQLAAQEKKVQDDGTPFYTVTVHSRPASSAAVADATGNIPVDRQVDVSEDPWVITFDNFLTDEEADHLIELGRKNEYKRSTDVGSQLPDGSYSAKESTTRTSENSWCSAKTGCRQDPLSAGVMDRIARVTGVPSNNFEDFQMLKYDVGQFYREHHDYIPHQRDRACGPRILTFFLYLSDVEEGGGTGMRNIGNLVVKPKKGRALLWPSVLNSDPSSMDGRTRHEAQSVEKGRKYAANVWIHLYDVVETQKRGCT